jgi:alkylation response protein AidB-like acyl-CoA dehydrogenase
MQFIEPSWHYSPSPYYDDSHRKLQSEMREWVKKNLPEDKLTYWDNPFESRMPLSVLQSAADSKFLATFVPGFTTVFPPNFELIAGIKVKDWNDFHTLIVLDEFSRCGSAGVISNISGALSIGLPPVIHYGSPELHKNVVMPCLQGQKRVCFAVTEPLAGSDVANLQTTATKTPDGKHYIVNGNKKWITNGMIADFFTTAVKTEKGISLLLIERGPGVTTQSMQIMGGWGSGTALVKFENVMVPVGNLLGKEGFGLNLIYLNFNKERWGTLVSANRFARICIEEAIEFAQRRKVFGEYLINNSAIIHKLGNCINKIEATHSWIETITYQFININEINEKWLSSNLALLKVQASQTLELCAREAAQIMGGIRFSYFFLFFSSLFLFSFLFFSFLFFLFFFFLFFSFLFFSFLFFSFLFFSFLFFSFLFFSFFSPFFLSFLIFFLLPQYTRFDYSSHFFQNNKI